MCNFVIFLPVNSMRMINLKAKKRAKQMSGRQEKLNMYMDFVEISEGKNRLEDQSLDGQTILKWILSVKRWCQLYSSASK
jgi:hypothetical protein